MVQTKRTPRTRAAKTSANPKRSTQVATRRVEAVGHAAAKQAGATRRQIARLLAEHPKVAASLAAGLITLGSAVLARKLHKSPATTAEDLLKKLADGLHKVAK